MYKFELKRLSDNVITHVQQSEDINYQVKIVKGYGYYKTVTITSEEGFESEVEQLDETSFEIIVTDLSIVSPEEKWNSLRDKRDSLLKETDFSQLADAPFSSEEKLEYRNYRTYLRNLPIQHNNESIQNATVLTFDQWKNQ